MNSVSSVLIALAIALALSALCVLARWKKWKLNIPRKVAAGVLAAVAFVRYMLDEEAFKAHYTFSLLSFHL